MIADRLRVQPARSPGLAASLIFGHALAAGVGLATLPVAGGLALALLIAFNLGRHLRLHAWRSAPSSVQTIDLHEDAVTLRLTSGDELRTRLHTSTFVSPVLIVLNCHLDGRWVPLHVVLARDCLPADEYRRLSVWLRWRRWEP